MKTNSKEAGLKIASSSRVIAAAALERIQSVILSADTTNAQTERSDLDAARLQLEDCLAGRRLGESSAEDEAAARDALAAAQKSFDAAQAAYVGASLEHIGLNRRLTAAEKQAGEANALFKSAECEWLVEEIRLAEESYIEQANAILQSYARITACTRALVSRGGANGMFSSSEDLEIPTVGTLSCAEFKKHHPNAQHAVGQYLVRAGRYHHIAPPALNIEEEITSVISPKSTAAIARFAKAVSGLIPTNNK